MKKILWTSGMLVGAAGVGAVTALLFAPQSGKRTRRQVRKYANRQIDNLQDMKNNFTSYVDDRMDGVRTAMTNCIESAQHSLEGSRAAVAASLSGIRGMLDGHAR